MREFSVLDPDFSIFGHYFLEASAGTGKTFTIEHLVPRLLLESSPQIRLQEVLLVTFTRAATRELKGRIYKNLQTVLRALEIKEGGPSYLAPIFLSGEEGIAIAKRKIEEAVFSFESAQIFTLHGFCLSLLQEFAFALEFFLHAEDEMDFSSKEKIKKYIEDFIRAGLPKDLMTLSQLRKVFIRKDLESFFGQVLHHLAKGKSIRCNKNVAQELSRWNEALAKFPRIKKETFLHELTLTSSRISSSLKWQKQIELFSLAMEAGFFSSDTWESLIEEKELFFSNMKGPSSKNKSLIIYPDLFVRLAEAFTSLHKQAIDGKALLLRLIQASKGHYAKGKKELSYYLPDDFVQELNKGLKNKQIQKQVRDKYKALIIDEFQDTDLDQWELFKELFLEGEEEKTIYLVGDPKQSIYGFRSADVYVYLNARSFFPEAGRCFLSTNYRSHPHLISCLNYLFSRPLGQSWLPLPKTNETIEVRAVAPKEEKEASLEGDKIGRIHFYLVEETAGKRKKFPSEETEETVVIPKIAQEVIRLKKEKGICFSEIAILVKDRFQAKRVQEGLSLFGIGTSGQKDFSCDDPVYSALIDILQLSLAPNDIPLLKKVLGGVIFQCSAADILGGMENPLLQKGRHYFAYAFSVIEKKGFPAFLSDLLEAFFKEESVEKVLLHSENKNIYFSVRQLLQLLLDKAPFTLHSPKEILLFLEHLEKSEEKELLQVPLEEEGDKVQLMTIHKSKGLEFTCVFLLGVAARHGKLDEVISIPGDEGKELAMAFEDAKAFLSHQEEVEAEKLRQLYVAFTRAKERLYVPFIVPKEPQEVEFGTASPLELFLGGFFLSSYQFSKVYENIAGFSLDEGEKILQIFVEKAPITYEVLSDKKIELSWQKEEVVLIPPPLLSFAYVEEVLSSFSSLASLEDEPIHVPVLSGENEIPGGATTGIIIHSLLEKLCKADLHRKAASERILVIENHLKGTPLAEYLTPVVALVERAFMKKIFTKDEAFCLSDIPSFDMLLEMEFLYKEKNIFMKGFIDMVFRYKNKFYVLDWKTNILQSYLPEDIAVCIKNSRYDLQARIYEEASKRYFNLFDFEGGFGGAIYFFLRGGDPFVLQAEEV